MDGDHDMLGDGCPAGPDCDDTNPMRGRAEQCDGVDNDCDGMTDEGFVDICRTCSPECGLTDVPGAAGWMPTADNSDGVIVDGDGALTLGRMETSSFAVWVANMDEGTVSKLDSRTNTELARYPSTRPDAVDLARPWAEACNWGGSAYDPANPSPPQGNCPSRTAVDQNFDAYVANRAFASQGTVTKYANRIEDCVDRNMNGTIDTSHDENSDGTIDVADPREFVGPEDECLLWTVPVGAGDGVPRALTIGIAPPDGLVGDLWVGLFNQMRACRLSATTGATIGCYEIAGFRTYGGTTDADGRIWFVDRSGARRDVLGWIDPASTEFHPAPPIPGDACAVPYGVTVAGDGNIYMANGCEPNLYRFEPASGAWTGYTTPGSGGTRGVAADERSLWVAISHTNAGYTGDPDNRIVQYNLADMTYVATHHIPTGLGPVGVGVSFDGSVWAVCQVTSQSARLDPATGAWIEHAVGLHPYTYSDFIGYGLNVFAEPRGRYRFVVEGCSTGHNVWQGLAYRSETPPMTSVEVWARSAETRAELDALPWVGPFPGPPVDLTVPPGPLPMGRFLDIELRLRTDDRRAAPRVFDVTVAGVCEPIIG